MSRADETFLDLALSRSTVRRSGARRAEAAAIAAALADPDTRVLTLHRGRAAVVPGDRPRLALRPPRAEDDRSAWFLGTEEERTYLAVEVEEIESEPDCGDDEVVWTGLREVGADIDDRDAGLLTTATALAEWHHRHQRCPRCGALTVVEQGGWVRRCPDDGSQHHPRTDPAVIMAVTDPGGRLLLGSGVAWPEHRVSVLAGFVEAGESLEAAVAREVHEEVGVTVTDVVYRGNQPWPFPASLMLGFTALATSTELVVDPVELRSAQWYDRARVAQEVQAGHLSLPSRVSIARRLIEEWFGGPLPSTGRAQDTR